MKIELNNVLVTAEADPQQIAEWFDKLDAPQQVQFFEHLWGIGDVRLSLKMAELNAHAKHKTAQGWLNTIRTMAIYGANMSEIAGKEQAKWQPCKINELKNEQAYWIRVGENVGIAQFDRYLKILNPVLINWDWKGTASVTHVMKLEKPQP